MQILLGVQETIVKINSTSIKIDYIQNFIHQHFNNVIINKKELYIPASRHNSHYRIFLLKWFYALYVKRTKNEYIELRETLLNRQHKAIKILLSKEITYKLTWKIVDQENIVLCVEPQNQKIMLMLKNYFQTLLHVNNTMQASLHVSTQEEKELLKTLLYSSEVLGITHRHIFNSKEMNVFLNPLPKEEKVVISPLQKAHTILGSFPDDDADTLKKRYKKLAKMYHPDKAAAKDDESIMSYTRKFQNILEAYEILLEQVG